MNRRNFINKTALMGLTSFIPIRTLEAMSSNTKEPVIDFKTIDSNDIIPAPDDPTLWKEWRDKLSKWKIQKQKDLKYDSSSYRSEPFRWVTSDFSCCFLMMCDSEFYDHEKNEYTVEKVISSGKQKFGGYDSVVLWHAYPRIGLDERNQFDFYREMPHGLTGLHDVVQRFHQGGVKVFINYNPWDTGTRREEKTDIELLIDIIRSIDADGIFLDTMKNAPDFREKLDNVKPGIVMEGEIALPVEHIQTHHMSWAQWFKDSPVPGVYRNKWFEHRHMQHAIDRWNSVKIAQLHTAWMNGSGMMIWENVFGQWLGWSERDKSIYRIMHSIQRQFADLFSGEKWTPLSHVSPVPGVYVSSWEGEEVQLWTLVNRNDLPVDGTLMKADHKKDRLYFDLVQGEEVKSGIKNGKIDLNGKMGAKGIAGFLSIPEKKINEFRNFLVEQKRISQLFSDDITNPVMTNQRIISRIAKGKPGLRDGMVRIPAKSLKMSMEYTLRECGAYGNVQDHLAIMQSNKLHSPFIITKEIHIKEFALDETPVTNAQFMEFILKSGYEPAISENFLKHWIKGKIPEGKDDHPVTYVDLIDAKAYAEWKGKRLPTEYEWQFAAQGYDALTFPWGNKMENNKCNLNTYNETTSVKAFPQGISPFGCYDMCGNTWELTDSEHTDGHTRFVILKGGSCFKASGSHWYMDGGPQKNSFFAKMLLVWPGLDRCSTVGFRCASDL
jgi:formylglycine-generating enzyme required for sulfatase activity